MEALGIVWIRAQCGPMKRESIIICPDCGKHVSHDHRCPKCGSEHVLVAGATALAKHLNDRADFLMRKLAVRP